MNHSNDQKLTGRIHQHLDKISKKIRASNNHYSLDTQVFTVKQAEHQRRPHEIIASIEVVSPFSTSDDRLILLRNQFDGTSSSTITEDQVTNALLHNTSLSASVDFYAHGNERRALHVLQDMLLRKECRIDKNRMLAFAAFSAAMNAVLRHIQTQTHSFSILTEEDTGRVWRVYPELNIEQFVCDVANITLTRTTDSPRHDYRIHYDLNLSFPVAQLNRLETPSDITIDFVHDALIAAIESTIDVYAAAGEMRLLAIASELREAFSSTFEKEKLVHACGDDPAVPTKTIKI